MLTSCSSVASPLLRTTPRWTLVLLHRYLLPNDPFIRRSLCVVFVRDPATKAEWLDLHGEAQRLALKCSQIAGPVLAYVLVMLWLEIP